MQEAPDTRKEIIAIIIESRYNEENHCVDCVA